MGFETDIFTTDHEELIGFSTLVQPLVYTSERYNIVITAPLGFVTDFASLPWIVQWYFKKLGKHRKAAAIHDYLYKKDNAYNQLPQVACDLIFWDAMLDSGVSPRKAKKMYQGVKYFGKGSYHKIDAVFEEVHMGS